MQHLQFLGPLVFAFTNNLSLNFIDFLLTDLSLHYLSFILWALEFFLLGHLVVNEPELLDLLPTSKPHIGFTPLDIIMSLHHLFISQILYINPTLVFLFRILLKLLDLPGSLSRLFYFQEHSLLFRLQQSDSIGHKKHIVSLSCIFSLDFPHRDVWNIIRWVCILIGPI